MKGKRKILIVEDNNLVVKMLTYLLNKEGFEIIVAKDGNAGAEALDIQKPDLILMDLVIPYRSGLEVTSLAKKMYPEVPIIVVSAMGLIDETISAALQLGVYGVVSKPFSPIELVEKIKSALISQ